MTGRSCEVGGCVRPPRSGRAPHCEMHYGRLRRGVPLGGPEPHVVRHEGSECFVEGCAKSRRNGKYCRMHDARVRRHGSPDVVIPHSERNFGRGEKSPTWKGAEITYSGAHMRVRAVKGSASDYECADCGARAREWSYCGESASEKFQDVNGYKLAYSDDVDAYEPRCSPCHWVYDSARASA